MGLATNKEKMKKKLNQSFLDFASKGMSSYNDKNSPRHQIDKEEEEVLEHYRGSPSHFSSSNSVVSPRGRVISSSSSPKNSRPTTKAAAAAAPRPAAIENKDDITTTKMRRQKNSLQIIMDAVFQALDLDLMLENEKEAVWKQGINVESTFTFLDRYNKGYIADTDVWQCMHAGSGEEGSQKNADSSLSFAAVCTLFRETKAPSATRKPGQLTLSELTHLLFPRQAEEVKHTKLDMGDDETRNVLYVTRSTVSCPGCQTRTQRTVEGCPQVTCPICRSVFRCNLIGDDREQLFRLTLTQKQKVRGFLKQAANIAEEQERIRKSLATTYYVQHQQQGLSSIVLDAFVSLSGDKGSISFTDIRKAVLSERALRAPDVDLIWWRLSKGRKTLSFVEFAVCFKPFGSS